MWDDVWIQNNAISTNFYNWKWWQQWSSTDAVLTTCLLAIKMKHI
jgi:hypothetical protein